MHGRSAAEFSWTGRDALIVLGVFAVTLSLFLSSTANYIGDSKYALLLSHNLLTRHSFVLDGYSLDNHQPLRMEGDPSVSGSTYQLESVGGHLYYFFPPGTSVLSVPFVALADWLGKPVAGPGGVYHVPNERAAQRMLAAVLMAALTAVFYRTSRRLLPVSWSAVIALGGALGTQVWSTASRAMWAHTWGILLLGWVLDQLLAQETGQRRLRPVLLASVLSWTYFVRPTNSVFIVGITVYLLLTHRALFVPYAVTGAAWFAGFVVYAWDHFGQVFPNYYQAGHLGLGQFWEGMAGNLISPSRGLLIHVPVVFFLIYLLARHRKHQSFPRLAWLTLAVSVGQLAAVSSHPPWYAGVCFGARYTTELVPWLVLLAVLGVKALLRWREEQGASYVAFAWRATLASGGTLLLASVGINARGANSLPTVRWNAVPTNIDRAPDRVWDWTYPQVLAGLIRPPLPAVFPDVAGGRIDFGHGAAQPFQREGWSQGGPEFCWTETREATLIFAANRPGTNGLRVKLAPYLVPGKQVAQTVNLLLNGQRIASFRLRTPGPGEYSVAWPGEALRARNVLTFELPDAVSPVSLKMGSDPRLLGVAVYWLELGGSTPEAAKGDSVSMPR